MDRNLLVAALLVLVAAERRVQRYPRALQVGDGVGQRLLHLRTRDVQARRRIDRVVRVERGREDREVAGGEADRQAAWGRQGTGREAPEEDRAIRVKVVVQIPGRQDGTGAADIHRARAAEQIAARRRVAELHELVAPELAGELAVIEDGV